MDFGRGSRFFAYHLSGHALRIQIEGLEHLELSD